MKLFTHMYYWLFFFFFLVTKILSTQLLTSLNGWAGIASYGICAPQILYVRVLKMSFKQRHVPLSDAGGQVYFQYESWPGLSAGSHQ